MDHRRLCLVLVGATALAVTGALLAVAQAANPAGAGSLRADRALDNCEGDLSVTLAADSPVLLGTNAVFRASVDGTGPWDCDWVFGDATSAVSQTLASPFVERHQYASVGEYLVTLEIVDSESLCGSATARVKVSDTMQLRLPLVSKLTDPIANGGFEAGTLDPWSDGGVLARGVATQFVHQGSYSALLGDPDLGDGRTGNIPVGTGWISQTISIQPGWPMTLTLHYRMQGYDGQGNDRFKACIREVGTQQLDCFVDSSFSAGAGSFKDTQWLSGSQGIPPSWRQVEIYLYHENENDGYWNTWTYVDAVKVTFK